LGGGGGLCTVHVLFWYKGNWMLIIFFSFMAGFIVLTVNSLCCGYIDSFFLI